MLDFIYVDSKKCLSKLNFLHDRNVRHITLHGGGWHGIHIIISQKKINQLF